MAEDTGQERTQQATPRRKQQARERGQVPHSRELNTMFVLLSSAAAGFFFGPSIVRDLGKLFQTYLGVEREVIFDDRILPGVFAGAVVDMLLILLPFFIVVIIAAVIAPILMGGVTFSTQALQFKPERLDPVQGMGRVFSAHGLAELLKALGKFVAIGLIGVVFIYFHSDQYFALSGQAVETGLSQTGDLLLWGFLAIAATMIVIAGLDVPFQLWQYNKQLRMTFQEFKDENKDTEGDPEVRARVKRMQRELAQRRMMAEVPKADVVVTNPEHYAVALRYDQKKMNAPIVVAKGTDLIALHIRTIAREHHVPILQAPLLARALHHTTELNREIPAGLYLAVAKVLAYVFQLKRQPYWQRKPDLRMDDLPIPDDMRYDA